MDHLELERAKGNNHADIINGMGNAAVMFFFGTN